MALPSPSGMTPLHCAAISHSATMKALSSGGLPDVALQGKAAEKLSCVQKLLSSGASLLSQVLQRSPQRRHAGYVIQLKGRLGT